MRAGGLACALLLLASGASNALPQYGGAGLQQQQQEEGQGAVVGGTSGTTGGFTPTQSSECALGNGCVPWQYCLNGVYKFNPSVNLDVRSPAKVPEDVSQKLCGQIGNVCCPIPEDILLQQQLAQAGVGGGVVAGVPGAGVHAEQTSAGGAGAGVHAEQTSAGVGGAGGYGGSGGIISGTVSGGGVVGGGLEQTSSGGSGHTSGALSSQCRVGFDCVPSYQCDGGVINTSGVGLINIRTKVTKCTNPEYPTVEAVCCKVPGASEPTILACPAPEECVPYGQCKEDGTINTDGTGLLDVRINTPCHLDSVNYEKGVCCLPPRPEPLATCPNGLVCELEGQCGTPGALAADGTYTSCYTGSGATGICCEPKLPLDACPGDLLCRVEGQCSSPAAIDGSYAECYIQGGSGSIGVCCEPPAPLVTCPGELDCKLQEHCGSPGAINVDGSYTTCYVGGGTGVGICCEPIAPLQECPGGQQCKFEGQCSSPGALNADGSYATCYVGSGVSDVGICCEPPPPVDVCPGGRTCSDQCSDPTAANADGTYTLCNKPDGSGIGACCELAKIVDVCPADSVCLPEVLCQGEFLNQDDVFVSYATGVSWTKCPLSGNLDTPGICCRTPKPISYPTADTCGVRNYALDTRIKSPLAKNEAVFGEFPWQAIIFFTNYTYKCGASLVDERHLITGAHCVAGLTPNQIQVRLGEWQVNTYDEPLKYVDASVAEIALHPDFKGGSLHNDIALITLAEPVEFQFHINSVCVPDEEQVFGETYCFATGWGKDAFNGSYQVILKQVDLPLVDNYACQEKLRKTRLGRYFILDKSFVCAGGEEGKDACTGDGGGPLVCKDAASGLYFLKGITAWGISCGEKDVPGVYADVQYLRPWLNSVWGQTAQQVSGYGK